MLVLAESSYGLNTLTGPAAGLFALLIMLALSRFVFGKGHGKTSATPPRDYGLLVPVAALPTRAAAEVARTMLAEQGIRATLSDRPAERGPVRISADGRELPREPDLPLTDLLVFPADIDRARALLTAGR